MECRFGSEFKSGEEDQHQVTADIDNFDQLIKDRNANAAEKVDVYQ